MSENPNVWRRVFSGRPVWMNALMLFCFYMTFVYVPWDLLMKPLERDVDVWLGIMFTGWQAKVGAVAHWLVYAAGSWGFYRMRPWMHPWAAVYVAQVGMAMFIWSLHAPASPGAWAAPVAAAPFALLAWKLWDSRSRFQPEAAPGP
jgi:hypothetical protein